MAGLLLLLPAQPLFSPSSSCRLPCFPQLPPTPLAETKGVPVEAVPTMFARHWLWGRVMGDKARDLIDAEDNHSAGSSANKLETASDKDSQ